MSSITNTNFNEYPKHMKWSKSLLNRLGLCPDPNDIQRSFLGRLWHHPLYVLHFISGNIVVAAEICGLIEARKRFLEITFIFPCITACLLSDYKGICGLIYAPCVNEILKRLDNLNLNLLPSENERDNFAKNLIQENVKVLLKITTNIIKMLLFGILMFGLAPLHKIIDQYYKTNELHVALPFVSCYPFQLYIDSWYFGPVYVHQAIAAVEVMFFAGAQDCFFFTCCTFIHIQFLLLQYDMERLVDKDIQETETISCRINIKKLALRHMELIKCVELLETIYFKSILFNVISSSLVICATLFNVMANDSVLVMASFTTFLSFSLLQIYMYCYFSDNIMESSSAVSQAIYNSRWYDMDLGDRRSLCIIMTRAQIPCKFTAYGFMDMNKEAFTSILSTSWSYFALLKTMYTD